MLFRRKKVEDAIASEQQPVSVAKKSAPHSAADANNQSFISSSIYSILFEIKYFFTSLFFAIKYVTADTKKHCLSFIVGLITIIIVTFVVSVLYNTIQKAPVIFMKLAEDSVGESDVLFSSRFTNTSTNPFLNFTELNAKLFAAPNYTNTNNQQLAPPPASALVTGISPRWLLLSNLYNNLNRQLNTSAVLLVCDTEREQAMGLGRTWPLRPLGRSEIHVRDALLRGLGLRADRGERLSLQIDMNGLLGVLTGRSEAISQGLDPSSGSSGIPSLGNNTQVAQLILGLLGVNISSTFNVNVTQLAQQFGIPLPPAVRAILDLTGGIVVLNGEQLLQLVASLLNGAGGLNNLLVAEYTVVGSITTNGGKYPSALGNIAVIDSRYFVQAIGDNLKKNANLLFLLSAFGAREQFDTLINNFQLEHYSMSVIGLYKNRFSAYLKSEKDLDKEMITFTNAIVNTLTVEYPISLMLPLVSALSGTKFVSLFLDQIFAFVVVMLGILGVILMYSLLLSNVDERTYEYGMLRALGLKQLALIQVILSQSMYFAIPGIIVGIALSFGVNALVEYVIAYVVSFPVNQMSYVLGWAAIVIPIALGLFIPLFSNILPIRRALSRSLRDSLDIAHQSFNETSVRMIKLAELGLEPWQTALSILLVVIGFVVYYVIPYSFIFQNLPLFFFILNGILLGMLFGLCMIAVVLQPVMEHLLLFVMLWGPDRRLMTLINKNLAGHRKRSRRTFLMFTLSVAFIIFAGVMFSLQSTNIVQSVELLVGADVSVQSSTIAYPLPTNILNKYLDRYKQDKSVVDYAYASFDLRKMRMMTGARFSSLAYYPTRAVRVQALTRNFLRVTYSRYFLYTQLDKSFSYASLPDNGKPDVVDSLYRDAGKATVQGERAGFKPERIFSGRPLGTTINDTLQFNPGEKYTSYLDVIISEAMKDEISVNVGQAMQCKATGDNRKGRQTSQDYISKARAMIYKMPGFFYSSYRVAASGSPVLLTTQLYARMAVQIANAIAYNDTLVDNMRATTNGTSSDPYDHVPMERLFIQFASHINGTQRTDILNGLRNYLDSDFSSINDVLDVTASTGTATAVLMGFFNIVAAIAVVLCFFILMLSFTANVRENSWEFGVLRAIGLSVNALIRAYIYEAMVLVMSAFFCGTLIGVVIALTLTAQFNLFLEMPFQFSFPYILFISIGVMAVVVAIVGSWLPARQLRKKEIALVLRGLE